MNLKELKTELQNIAVLTGSAKPEDFIGLTALDVIASYAVSLSGGRLNDEATILGIAQGAGNVRAFLHAISRGSIPVPTMGAILEFLNERDASQSIMKNLEQEFPAEPPAPAAPTEKEIVAHHRALAHGVRKELLNRRDLDVSEDVERNRLQNLFAGEILNEFIARFGIQKFKELRSGVANIKAFRDVVMGAKTAEELMDLFEGKRPKQKTMADAVDDEPLVAPMMTPEKPKVKMPVKKPSKPVKTPKADSPVVTTKGYKKSSQK